MPRRMRVHIEQGALYYVTCRGDYQEKLFLNDQDYQTYLELIRKYKAKYCFKLYAFVLQPEHLHLLVEPCSSTTISQIMHDLNSNYTKYFNTQYGRKGHLFEERYRLALVEKEPYLAIMTVFIHRNPMVIGLVNSVEGYRFGSGVLYLQRQSPAEGLSMEEEIKEVLESLGGIGYSEFLAGIAPEQMHQLGEELHQKGILGSQLFVERVHAQEELQKRDSSAPPQNDTVCSRDPLSTIHDPVQEELAASGLSSSSHAPRPTPHAPVQESSSARRWRLAGSAAMVLSAIFILTLYSKNMEVRKNFTQTQLEQEKTKTLLREMDEKMRADSVSYQAMAKRLELEKSRVTEETKKGELEDNE